MSDDVTTGPHPGTPFPIPNESAWPVDAPKFAPDMPQDLARGVSSPFEEPMMYAMQMEQNPHQSYYSMETFNPYPQHQGAIPHGIYDYPIHPTQASISRPATPAPYKRPASWSRVVNMESPRPAKKAAPNENLMPQEVMPTMLGM